MARAEPLLWLRRLVIWASPEQVIREVPFRRGLNVVWSPDPGRAGAELGVEGESGHGAGKTLLCRMIRYCLGEETFADADLRGRIGTALPSGRVGLQLVIGGVDWSVVRPIGKTRKCFVGPGVLEDVVAAGRAGSVDLLVGAISTTTSTATLDVLVDPEGANRAWLFALAWLARDQESRFAHLVGWRHAAGEARSPAAGRSKEDLVLIARLLLHAVSKDELDLRAARIHHQAEIGRRERERDFLRESLGRLRRRLSAHPLVTPSTLSTEALGARAISRLVATRADAVRGSLTSPQDTRLLQDARAEQDSAIAELATLDEQLRVQDGARALHADRLAMLRGERANLSAEEIKARLGPMCPVCFIPIDEALTHGCALAPADAGAAIRARRERTIAEIRACEELLERLSRQRAETESVRESRAQNVTMHQKNVADLEAQIRNNLVARHDELLALTRLYDDALALEELHAELGAEEIALAETEQTDKQLERDLETLRERHSATVRRFDELFQYVMCGLLSDKADASLVLHANAFRAKVSVGGTAMESLKVVGFDLAAMLMAVEGRGAMPGLLIHDSPREADLGASHYAKLFQLVLRLEGLGAPPPFQYIVTTTTAPPEQVAASDAVVALLQGHRAEDRLLRRAV